MAYCSKCGVAVESDRQRCPLCNVPIHRYDEEPQLSSLWPVQKELPRLKKSTQRLLILLPILALLVVAFLIIWIVDVRMNGGLTWSRYPLTAVGGAFFIGSGIALLADTKILTVGWITAVVLIMLWLLDSFADGISWFTTVGIPVTLVSALYLQFSLLGLELLPRRFHPQATLQALLVTLLCICIDAAISRGDGKGLSWSLITAVPLMSLFFIGAVGVPLLGKVIDLDKYLHR